MLQKLTNSESVAIISLLAFKLCEATEFCVSKDNIIADKDIKIASLEAALAQKSHPKNSGNSSLPPSSDFAPPKRNQSLRVKSDKIAGAQLGHRGHTLQMKAHADVFVRHDAPCVCAECGNDLTNVAQQFLERRQVVDIPPVTAVYTEHSIYSKTCNCGHVTKSSFPPGINSLIQYGPNVESTAAYMHARQYIPFDRMGEFFNDVMGIPICAGSIVNMIKRFADKAKPVYESIKTGIEQAPCIGSDETGAKENGKKIWFWTWQNSKLTYIVYSPSRGYCTIESEFPNGLSNTILVHDRWAAQIKCPAQNHQICTAHLLRDLNFVEQCDQSQWATDFKYLIKDALLLDEQLNDNEYALPNARRDELENKLQILLEQPLPAKQDKAISLQKSLSKIKDYIFLFLHYAIVPPDNNGSERAIRNVKVKQKVSGQFKSEEGAKTFAIIRSIIDTALKAGKDVFNELFLIANLASG